MVSVSLFTQSLHSVSRVWIWLSGPLDPKINEVFSRDFPLKSVTHVDWHCFASSILVWPSSHLYLVLIQDSWTIQQNNSLCLSMIGLSETRWPTKVFCKKSWFKTRYHVRIPGLTFYFHLLSSSKHWVLTQTNSALETPDSYQTCLAFQTPRKASFVQKRFVIYLLKFGVLSKYVNT